MNPKCHKIIYVLIFLTKKLALNPHNNSKS